VGEGCAVPWLCFAALLREFNPPARAAAGMQRSVFIDGEGRLSSCGSAPVLPSLVFLEREFSENFHWIRRI